MIQSFHLHIPKADELALQLELDSTGVIKSARLTGVGGPDLLEVLGCWRDKIRGKIADLEIPEGDSTGELMLRELLLKAKEQWSSPYSEIELCHCRAVPTTVVESAILLGAHTPEKVSRWTSASTSCGTCRRDVEAILAARLKQKAS